MKLWNFLIMLLTGLTGLGPTYAGESLAQLLTHELANQYPGARIEFAGEPHWNQADGLTPGQPLRLLSAMETARGLMHFEVLTQDSEGASHTLSGWIPYSAKIRARVAARRILPGEHLSEDALLIQEIDVAQGQSHEMREHIFAQLCDHALRGAREQEHLHEVHHALEQERQHQTNGNTVQ